MGKKEQALSEELRLIKSFSHQEVKIIQKNTNSPMSIAPLLCRYVFLVYAGLHHQIIHCEEDFILKKDGRFLPNDQALHALRKMKIDAMPYIKIVLENNLDLELIAKLKSLGRPSLQKEVDEFQAMLDWKGNISPHVFGQKADTLFLYSRLNALLLMQTKLDMSLEKLLDEQGRDMNRQEQEAEKCHIH